MPGRRTGLYPAGQYAPLFPASRFPSCYKRLPVAAGVCSKLHELFYCRFVIKVSSADLGGRVNDSGSVARGSSTILS